jgi:mono/diheme cytochrome c family protein
MRCVVMAFAAVSLAALAGSPHSQEKKQEPPAEEFKIPPEYVNMANPAKPTAAALEDARRLYGYDCAMCHGKDGDGKGELVEQMKLELKDWRNPSSLEKMTDGELFYILTKGKGKMVPEEQRAKAEQRWQLVNLIRSFAKKGNR